MAHETHPAPASPTSKDAADAAVHAALARLWPDAPAGAAPDAAADAEPDAETLRRLETIWADVPALRAQPGYAELLGPLTLRERIEARLHALADWLGDLGLRPAFAAAAALLLLCCGTTLLVYAFSGPEQRYETALAEVRELRLPDGSLVTLGAKSKIEVDFAEDRRLVKLLAGEAFFAVAKDSARPFHVLAGRTNVRVVGTKFNVNRSSEAVRVAVLEGVVQVTGPALDPAADGRAPVVPLTAGQQIVTETRAPPAPAPAPAAPQRPQVTQSSVVEPGSWRSGNLAYENMPLGQIVADANRYYGHEIRIASAAARNMRLTTGFRVDQVDRFLETVESALPLDVVHEADGDVTIVERR